MVVAGGLGARSVGRGRVSMRMEKSSRVAFLNTWFVSSLYPSSLDLLGLDDSTSKFFKYISAPYFRCDQPLFEDWREVHLQRHGQCIVS